MSSEMIGRLERLPLREVWRYEDFHFTQWLQENIDVLSSQLGLSLVNVEREKSAGSFSIDLVAEEQNGTLVIIEAQLGKSDHDHLGKVLTYLTAMEARAAIWIVAEARPEHVAVIAWLNASTNARFYLVQVEAVRIGGSPPAPLLTLLVGPSSETAAIALTKRAFRQQDDIRQRWWQTLLTDTTADLHRHLTPGPYNTISATSGFKGLSYNYLVAERSSSAQLYIDAGPATETYNSAIFSHLLQEKERIETAFGGSLEWDQSASRRACFIRYTIEGGYRTPEDEWPEIQSKVVAGMNRLETTLRPFLKALNFSQ